MTDRPQPGTPHFRIVARREGTVALAGNAAPSFRIRALRVTSPRATVPAAPRRHLRLVPPPTAWQEFGWTQHGNRFTGHYRAGTQTWPGVAVSPPTRNTSGAFDFYILRPP